MRLGVDLGGTETEIIALDDDGDEILRRRIASPRDDYAATLAAIAGLVTEAEHQTGGRGSLGIAIPGTLSGDQVKNANSTWLNGKPLARDLEERLEREVRLANDANCFALSESTDGAAAGFEVVFGVILGTGVGGGVVVQGHLLGGAHGIAGEWGHNPLPGMSAAELAEAPDCYCGKRGCIETWCSGPAVAAEFMRRTGRTLSAEEIAASDTAEAKAAMDRYTDRLARALASVMNILDPDAIVLGGGLSNIESLYRNLPPLVEAYAFTPQGPPRIVKNRHSEFEWRSRRGLVVAGMTFDAWPAFCRDCLSTAAPDQPCPQCSGTRILAHPELNTLEIAHLDCDAFYAAIEKRDHPSLRDKPLIIGGGTRGVVSTACYIARKSGVRSAMPMFQARKLCPQAIILKPRIAYYAEAARKIRGLMRALTPLVEPLSLDEAYLDLSGTDRMQGMPPAMTMAKLALQIEREVGITVSIGLSGNKFLAKLASELDKPRGFAVIGMGEAKSFLRDKPVGIIRGAGKVLQARLERDGLKTIGQLQDMDARELVDRYGSTGLWLSRVAQAIDGRAVDPGGEMKTISSETTFNSDLARLADLEAVLWRQAERVSARAKGYGLSGRTVVLKLKTSNFRLLTRSASLDAPTQLADRIFRTAQAALKREADGRRFRLLGVGLSNLAPGAEADPGSLIDPASDKRAAAERAMDKIRSKFGSEAVGTGRAFKKQ